MTVLALIALGCVLLPALVYLRNLSLFRPPAIVPPDHPRPAISVLIPARNEERSIGQAVRSILASEGVDIEVVVLDDHSEDNTQDIVEELAKADPRVRLESAPRLPSGWSGKQHACFTLASHARHPILTFLDADVRLAPDALARMAYFQQQSGAPLVSGFPRQETGTWLEKLVIPLINWLLMGYLPMGPMRKMNLPGLGTGCGQWFLTTAEAYRQVGGHSAVRSSFHDGIQLPRAYRKAGLMTDICDATELATCRMYHSASQVWNGLAKNAREGLAAPGLIWFWTFMLLMGQVVPFMIVALGLDLICDGAIAKAFYPPEEIDATHQQGIVLTGIGAVGCLLAWFPRFDAARRFQASWLGALLHPVGITMLVGIQWYATIRTWVGRPVGWKGRPNPTTVID